MKQNKELTLTVSSFPVLAEFQNSFLHLIQLETYNECTILEYENRLKDCYGILSISSHSKEGTFLCPDGSFFLSASGVLLFTFPFHSTLKFIPHSASLQFSLILFHGSQANSFYLLFHTNYRNECLWDCHTKVELTIPQFRKDTEKLDSTLVNANLLYGLLTTIVLSSHQQIHPNPQEKAPPYIREMLHLFHTHMSDKYTIDALADRFHVNKYRLIHEFTKCIGVSPISFLNQIRIEAAADFLVKTDEKVKSIGYRVGIENTNHFITLFKRQKHCTPLKYRSTHPAPPLKIFD